MYNRSSVQVTVFVTVSLLFSFFVSRGVLSSVLLWMCITEVNGLLGCVCCRTVAVGTKCIIGLLSKSGTKLIKGVLSKSLSSSLLVCCSLSCVSRGVLSSVLLWTYITEVNGLLGCVCCRTVAVGTKCITGVLSKSLSSSLLGFCSESVCVLASTNIQSESVCVLASTILQSESVCYVSVSTCKCSEAICEPVSESLSVSLHKLSVVKLFILPRAERTSSNWSHGPSTVTSTSNTR